jgi:hypothetical protein
LAVGFDEDRCRTRKDHSAKGVALTRKAALKLLKREPSNYQSAANARQSA